MCRCRPDLIVYAVALLLSLGSGISFGLLPARQIWRTDAAQVMKSGAGTVLTFRRFTLRDVLLVVQIALCTLLVTASLVAVRGMQRSLRAPLGVQPMVWCWRTETWIWRTIPASRCWSAEAHDWCGRKGFLE